MASDPLLDLLTALETELHGSSTRGNVSRLSALLHDDFEEVGRSGARYRRDDVLVALPAETRDTTLASDGFRMAVQSEVFVLLTYRSARVDMDGRLTAHTLRSSLWQKMGDGWQLRYHQGTPTAPFTMKRTAPRER